MMSTFEGVSQNEGRLRGFSTDKGEGGGPNSRILGRHNMYTARRKISADAMTKLLWRVALTKPELEYLATSRANRYEIMHKLKAFKLTCF